MSSTPFILLSIVLTGHLPTVTLALVTPQGNATFSCPSGWQRSVNTAYESWPRCCKHSPNYDPKAPTEECTHDSGCKYQGMFAYHQCGGKDGQCSLDYVKNTNLVSFFSISGEHKKYKNKIIRIQARGQTIEALVADTCGDDDCHGCCTKNAKHGGGFLIDMEYYTVRKSWPTIKEPEDNLFDTDICWQSVDDREATKITTV